MPNPDSERWKQIEAVIGVVLETPVTERERVLSEMCADDAELRSQVEAALAASEASEAGAAAGGRSAGGGLSSEDIRERLGEALAGRYAIEREIGRGGMAVVFLARDLRHDRQVALKVLRPELAVTVGAQRFLREVGIVAKLHHPHILALFDSGEANGLLYYVVPYVEGGSLRRRLQREGPLEVEDALRIALEVADGLSSAHDHGVVHRDIKPENILMSEGRAFIADFGIARALSVADPTITAADVNIGTPLYMSPEQAEGSHSVDARTDIYALACVLFEMLAGQPPYTGRTRHVILAKHASQPVPELRQLRGDVPVEVEAAVARAMAKAAADRFRTVAEFAAALAGAARPGPAEADRTGAPGTAPATGGAATMTRPSFARRFWSDVRRRKVHRAVVLYIAAAFGFLGAADLLNLVGILSDGLYRVIGILVLAGFPVAVVLAWAFDLTPEGLLRTPRAEPAAGRDRRASPFTRAVELTIAGMVVVGLSVLVARLLSSTAEAATPVPDYLVQAHRTDTTTPAEEEYALIAAEALTRQLTGWVEARAVPSVALPRLRSTLGLTDPIRSDLGESLELAGLAGAGTLVTVTVDLRGDSAFLEAALFRVGSGTQIGRLLHAAADTQRASELVAPIAANILGLSGAPDQVRAVLLRRPSENLQALRQLQPGIESLNRWRLGEAERYFRAALQLDSTLSLAHHYLALTLYAKVISDEYSPPGIGGEIRRHTVAALRRSANLPRRDSLHVAALHAFQAGEYERARELYASLVSTDSADTYAWLLRGSVEVQDPWAVTGPQESPVPRSNLNTAIRSFTRTVRLSPDFFLGYGPLFDLFVELSSTMREGACPGFERPGDRVVLIWDARNPDNQVFFCPIARDSIEWIDAATATRLHGDAMAAGAVRFLDQSFVELSRWADYAPDDPKPHEEMARWLLARRQATLLTADLPGQDDLAGQATAQLEAALALRADTVPADLIRIASLYLAADARQRALDLTDQALAELRAAGSGAIERAPLEAANTYLATGRLSRALELLESPSARQTMFAPDPETGGGLRFWVEPVLARVEAYGAVGLVNERVRRDFATMERTWAQRGYGAREIGIIKRFATSQASLALALDEPLRRQWFQGVDELSPLWRGFLASDPDLIRRSLDEAIEDLDRQPSGSGPTYLVALLARHAGRDSLAISLFDRMDRLSLPLDRLGLGWGLRSLSHFQRAEAHDAMGNRQQAILHYTRFLELWDGADQDLQPFVRQARSALAR